MKRTALLSIGLPVVLAVLCSVSIAYAETGVTDKEILIGSCSVLTGPAQLLGIRQLHGAKAYLNEINEKGGVHGRKIRVIEGDDRYEPDGAIECFNKTILGEGVFAGAFFVGTPTGAKHAPMAETNKVPIVGWFTGANLLHDPFKHYVFNVRASYFDETRERVDGLWDAGVRKLAVIYQDDAFGVAVLEGVKRALKAHGAEPVALGTFPRNTLDVDKGIELARAANPEAVEVVGPYAPVAEIIKRSKEKGFNPIFMTVSFVGTEAFVKAGGKDVEGTVITQVMPPYVREDLPAVAHYLKNMKKYFPDQAPSFSSMEGFVDAMVLVDALKRAGSDLSRDKFIEALESMKQADMGLGATMKIDFSMTDHKGLDKVYFTVVKGGQVATFTDWKEIKK